MLKRRTAQQYFREPLSIYEVHFGSWRRKVEDGNRPFTYREMVEPQVSHFRQVPFRTSVKLPQAEQGSPT